MRLSLLIVLLTGCVADPTAEPDIGIDASRVDMARPDADVGDASIDAQFPAPDAEAPDMAPVLPSCAETDPIERELDALPLDVVLDLDFDGACDTTGWTYEWVVTAHPDGSTALPYERFFNNQQPANGGEADDRSTPTAKLLVDVGGAWALELRGIPPGGAAIVLQTVRFWAGRWGALNIGHDHPRDLAARMILAHPNSEAWFSDPHSCWADNPRPDWGPLGPDASDPTFFGTLRNSMITLDTMENTEQLGAPYLLGVSWIGDGEAGPTDISISISNAQAIRFEGRLGTDAEFWFVAKLHWTEDGGWIEPIDRYESERRP